MPTRIADVEIPDTRLVTEATELVRSVASPLLFDHSRRVFLFGSLQARNRNLSHDPELLYVGAMFHDLGLTETHRTSHQRFEIDGADEAARFLRQHELPQDSIRIVWTAIALHTTPEIPAHMEPEIALVTAGVELDVLGVGFEDLSAAAREEIIRAHPRPNFKRRILQAFTEGIQDRPQTTFGNVKADVLERFSPGYVRPNFVETVENSAWSE